MGHRICSGCGGGTDGTNKSYLQVAVNTGYTAFERYCEALNSAGYTSGGITGSSTTSIAHARYLAADGTHTVYVYIINAMKEVRVVVDTQADKVGAYANGFVYESTTGETAQPMMCLYGLSKPLNGYSNDSDSPYATKMEAGGSMAMEACADGRYWGQVSGIAAKRLDDTYYVAAVYTDEAGNACCTGVIAYSLSQYCMKKADGTMSELAQATAMYGYYAKHFFTA